MVKKTTKYNVERLLNESEKRVLNEHELIFLLGKTLLDEAWWNPRTWFQDKQSVYVGQDGRIHSATKYWEPNKVGQSGGFKYKDDKDLVSLFGDLANDPQRCIRILNTPNHRITKQLSPAERKKLLAYFRDKANGLNYASVQTNDPKTVAGNNGKITSGYKITTNQRNGNQWWKPIKQRTHYINNPDVNDDNDPRFNGKLNLNLGSLSESTILSEGNSNIMQGDELVNFIIQNNLKPGDLLSGNNLKLHNKKILATVNAYRQTKNLPPLSQDGIEIDPRDNDTYRRDMEREKTAQRDAYNNAARMRNAISTLGSGLDNNDVDYSSNNTTTGRVGRFFRGLGNLVTKGKWNTGDNATFKAVNGGSRSQEDINFDVNAIRGYMQDFGIPGQGSTGQITDAQVYDFIQNMNKPVLKLASGKDINMLQLRSYVATGKMDKRTYDNIIHQYKTQNANAQPGKETPVSLEANKMVHYVQVFDRTTHRKKLVPETDRNGNVIWYDQNDSRLNQYDRDNQKAEYRGAFSNLDSAWQNDLYNWTQNSGEYNNNVRSNKQENITKFGNLMKQYEALQIQLQQDPQNAQIKASMDNVVNEFDALATRMSTKNGQFNERLYKAIKSKFDTMIKGNTVYDVRSNNPYLQKLQAKAKELDQKFAQASRILAQSKAVARTNPTTQAQQTVAKNQADYDQILNEKNKVASEITRITSTRALKKPVTTTQTKPSGTQVSTRTTQSYTPTRTVIGGYSEGFTPELAGFVFLESFIREFKLANTILREGEEQTTQLDPSNPIESAFIKADQIKAQDGDDSTEMQNASETNPLAQDTQQSQAQAVGSKFGTALTGLYQGAGKALSQFQVDRKLLNIRRRNTELDNRCLSYVHNPFQPIPQEDEQWLTSSEKAKIEKLRRGHSEYEHLWNQPANEEQLISQGQGTPDQNMMTSQNQANADQSTDTNSTASKWSAPGKNFDQDDIRTWAYYDDMGELHFTGKAEEYMKKRWKNQDERDHFKNQIKSQLQKDYDSKHKKTSGFSKRQFDQSKTLTFKKTDFNQLFTNLENNPKTKGKFNIDPQTGCLVTKPTDGSRPVVVADPRDKTVSNIELKYAISNPSQANAQGDIPILVLNKKQGKPTSKDLTRYSESISDILTYSEFKKQFKESIQKQSNEISSKNMYQLYLLGKLKNLL